MIPYLFLGLLLVVATIAGLRWFARADPAVLAQAVRWAAIGLGAAGIGLLLFEGRVGLLFVLASILLPLLQRWRQARRRAKAAAGPTPGGRSRIATAYLEMELDHDSGRFDGRVLAGRFSGRRLDELSPAELRELLAECRAADLDSVPLLEAYLDRRHGPGWRQGGEEAAAPAPPSGAMTREEAYAILGLDSGAGPEPIRQAHRRLMRKLHPDHGGSTYLAARINQARDLLLGA
jgi:hypothetical protein